MGRPIRLAKSKQFVKTSNPESAKPKEKVTTESVPDEKQAKAAEPEGN